MAESSSLSHVQRGIGLAGEDEKELGEKYLREHTRRRRDFVRARETCDETVERRISQLEGRPCSFPPCSFLRTESDIAAYRGLSNGAQAVESGMAGHFTAPRCS